MSCLTVVPHVPCFVPVSMAAKDWKVSPRRIRFLLSQGRMEGRRQANGYWEVAFPYRLSFGVSGPPLRRFQRTEHRSA